jgi:hypothetical protein
MIVRRKDHGILGSVEEVKAAIGRSFPGASFVSVPSGAPLRKPRFGLHGAIYWLNARPPLPSWEGSFHSDGFAVQFELGSNARVRYIPVDLYGSGHAMIEHFEQLKQDTGWMVTKPSLLALLRLRKARWSGA